MSTLKDPFELLIVEDGLDDFEALSRKSVNAASPPAAPPEAATARFHGFDHDDQLSARLRWPATGWTSSGAGSLASRSGQRATGADEHIAAFRAARLG